MPVYSDAELDAAVAAGIISAENATAFREFTGRYGAAPDEEQFRLLTGFNDIFISIAILVFLIGTSLLASKNWPEILIGLSWALAEYFTRKRRLSLPSIILAASFGFGTGFLIAAAASFIFGGSEPADLQPPLVWAVTGIGLAGAFYLHWQRFQVPITVALCVLAAAESTLAVLIAMFPGLKGALPALMLMAGLVVFAVAMRWDTSDRERATRRTDIAFWLHLAAAPMIAHSLFKMFRVFSSNADAGVHAGVVIGLYLVMTFVALAIDRRALLTAGLAYVLFAISTFIRSAGSPAGSFAMAGFVIGAALLMLSAFWNPAWRLVVGMLPEGMQAFLPGITEPRGT